MEELPLLPYYHRKFGDLILSNCRPTSYGAFDLVVFSPDGVNDYLYVWAAAYGLFISRNGGNLWTSEKLTEGSSWSQAIGTSQFSLNYWRGSIAVAPKNLYRAYVAVSPFSSPILGVFRTNNTGSSWTNVLNLGNSLTDQVTLSR